MCDAVADSNYLKSYAMQLNFFKHYLFKRTVATILKWKLEKNTLCIMYFTVTYKPLITQPFSFQVKTSSKAEAAGLKHGDLIVAVNGEKVRDLPHDEVVQLIRQSSVDADVITIAVVPKIPENQAEILSEEVVDETTKKA